MYIVIGMARKGYVGYDIPKKMADALDTILRKEGHKHAIESRSELIKRILSDFIAFYENDTYFKGIIGSKKLIDQGNTFHADSTDDNVKSKH
jgi:metal-responsive CopG/Arc/MetJ family transcriptional regulator